MSFWISFPFWMMLVLLVINTLLVNRFSAHMDDNESGAKDESL